MDRKTVLFCLGSREELIELETCISTLKRDGHEVYILYEFPPLPLLDVGTRAYADELPPIPMFERFLLDIIVVGRTSEVGKILIPKAVSVRLRFLYQGHNPDSGGWTELHEHLFMVRGKDLRDWSDMDHNPWLSRDKGGGVDEFTGNIREHLADD